MKVLIIGSSGMLGQALAKEFADQNPLLLDRNKLDITDYSQVAETLFKIRPEIVINAAAYTAVDDCEKNRVLAMKVNGEGPGNLAKVCAQIGAILVHYSTDYVFSGQKADGYPEDYSKIEPLSVYGESKALGEKLIQKNCQRYYLLRTAWLYGPGGQNFVDTIIKLGQEKPELKVVDDQRGSPTYVLDLARQTKNIVGQIKPPFGIYHVTNSGVCTWYGFTREIFKIKEIKSKLIPCQTDEFPRPAQRPKYSILLNTKLPLLRSWIEALADYLKTRN